jgi:hypothetical protein
MLPAKASPNERTMLAVRGDETTTATSATVTMLPSRLKNRSGIVLPFLVVYRAMMLAWENVFERCFDNCDAIAEIAHVACKRAPPYRHIR